MNFDGHLFRLTMSLSINLVPIMIYRKNLCVILASNHHDGTHNFIEEKSDGSIYRMMTSDHLINRSLIENKQTIIKDKCIFSFPQIPGCYFTLMRSNVIGHFYEPFPFHKPCHFDDISLIPLKNILNSKPISGKIRTDDVFNNPVIIDPKCISVCQLLENAITSKLFVVE